MLNRFRKKVTVGIVSIMLFVLPVSTACGTVLTTNVPEYGQDIGINKLKAIISQISSVKNIVGEQFNKAVGDIMEEFSALNIFNDLFREIFPFAAGSDKAEAHDEIFVVAEKVDAKAGNILTGFSSSKSVQEGKDKLYEMYTSYMSASQEEERKRDLAIRAVGEEAAFTSAAVSAHCMESLKNYQANKEKLPDITGQATDEAQQDKVKLKEREKNGEMASECVLFPGLLNSLTESTKRLSVQLDQVKRIYLDMEYDKVTGGDNEE